VNPTELRGTLAMSLLGIYDNCHCEVHPENVERSSKERHNVNVIERRIKNRFQGESDR
jgi:hypothetical protein